MIWIQCCETCRFYDADEGACFDNDNEYSAEPTENDFGCDNWEG